MTDEDPTTNAAGNDEPDVDEAPAGNDEPDVDEAPAQPVTNDDEDAPLVATDPSETGPTGER